MATDAADVEVTADVGLGNIWELRQNYIFILLISSNIYNPKRLKYDFKKA